MRGPTERNGSQTGDWWAQVQALDAALYGAVAQTPTPDLDRALGRLSRAADHSKIWIGVACFLGATGRPGRRAAANGLAAVAVASALVNLGLKPLGDRRRPDRSAQGLPSARLVKMPKSTSFPSGHSASAFAFATGVGESLPLVGVPLTSLAALVAYSRVHTGVHYPGDVVVGSLVGAVTGSITGRYIMPARRRSGAGLAPERFEW